MTKNNSRLSTLPTKSRPKSDIVEPEIDVENAPVVQGSFEVTKTDADITQKKMRTSTLRPFTITNGAVRMKTKKTTIEKVKPLPKVPENLTANILKLENVTKPYHFDRTTTYRPITTTEEIQISTITEPQIKYAFTSNVMTTKKPHSNTTSTTTITTTATSTTIKPQVMPSMSMTTDSVINLSSSVSIQNSAESVPVSDAPPPSASPPRLQESKLTTPENKTKIQEGNVPMSNFNFFTSAPILDNQPWLPITPIDQQLNSSLKDAKKKIHNSVSPPLLHRPQISSDASGFKLLSRNKLRPPSTSNQKPIPPIHYHSYTNPALLYGIHDIERLGNGYVKPYPIPVDKINAPLITRNPTEDLVLNKGEMLTTNSQPVKLEPMTSTKAPENVSAPFLASEQGTQYVNAKSSNSTISATSSEQSTESTGVGSILLELLNGDSSNASSVSTEDGPLSRMDELELTDDHTETLDSLATAISSMETLSFKNIKDYIMATTKSFFKDAVTQPTTMSTDSSKPANTTFRSHVTTVKIEPPSTHPVTEKIQNLEEPVAPVDDLTSALGEQDVPTPSYVEVETVQYTPGGISWDAPALFPVQSKWEYVNGSIVYPDKLPVRKVYNETLQAWIIENPKEPSEKINLDTLIRNHAEPIKNISAIFDTLASKLGIAPNVSTKLPPFMSFFEQQKHKGNVQSKENLPLSTTIKPTTMKTLKSTAAPKSTTTTTTTARFTSTSRMPTSLTPHEDSLPILLNPLSTESAESVLGQAEVEEIDPTQYEQMLLVDRVSTALRPTTSVPLVTLMPVKSNSGLRFRTSTIDRLTNSGRGFPPPAPSPNRKPFEDTSFVVRTNINVSS